jgi:hypothetical protein
LAFSLLSTVESAQLKRGAHNTGSVGNAGGRSGRGVVIAYQLPVAVSKLTAILGAGISDTKEMADGGVIAIVLAAMMRVVP